MIDPASPPEKTQKKRHSTTNGLSNTPTPTREKRLRKLNPIYADYEQDKVTEKVQQSIITGTTPTKKRKNGGVEPELSTPPPIKRLPKGYAMVPDIPSEEKPLPAKRERKSVNYAELNSKPKRGGANKKVPTPEESPILKQETSVEETKPELVKLKRDRKKELEEKLGALDAQLELLGEDIEAKTSKEMDFSDILPAVSDLKSPKQRSTQSPTSRSHRTPRKRGSQYQLYKEELSPALEGCKRILKSIMEHRHAWPFNKPVDPIALNIPDYFDIIKRPMDFGTIKHNLDTHAYDNEDEFCSHVRLVFSNAFKYNPPEHDICLMAQTLSDHFEKKFTNLKSQLAKGYGAAVLGLNTVEATLVQLQEVREELKRLRDEAHNINATPKPPPKPKGRKREDNKPMTFEEKKNLSLSINELPSEALGMVVKIVSDNMPQMTKTTEGRELEIDLDQLDSKTLRALEKYVNGILNKKPKRAPRPSRAQNKKPKKGEKPKEIEGQPQNLTNGRNGKSPNKSGKPEDSSSSSDSSSSNSDSSDSSSGSGSDSSDSSDSEDDTKHKSEVSPPVVPPTVTRPTAPKIDNKSQDISTTLSENNSNNNNINHHKNNNTNTNQAKSPSVVPSNHNHSENSLFSAQGDGQNIPPPDTAEKPASSP